MNYNALKEEWEVAKADAKQKGLALVEITSLYEEHKFKASEAETRVSQLTEERDNLRDTFSAKERELTVRLA